MNALAIFGVSALMSTVSSATVGKLYVWPRLQTLERNRALAALVAPHMLRFIGLSLLVPGVVSPLLPAAFAVPTAYGDFIALCLRHHRDHRFTRGCTLGDRGNVGIQSLGHR